MARAVLVVLVSLLVLVGCGQSSSQVERQEKNEGAEKPVQQDESARSQAKNASGETAKKADSEKKPKSEPKPEPAQESALKEDRERARFDATTTVARVVDGDTIEIAPAIDGIEEVRLIGVDTPETKDPDEGIEPYGQEASAFATDELTG